MENVRQIVARNVRAGRDRLGLTQEDLAVLAEMDLSYLSRVERGVANPSIEMLARLAVALRTTAPALLTKSNQ